MKSFFVLLVTTACAFAQGNAPFVPPPVGDTSPASALDDMPAKTISNGIVSAKVYLPVPLGFYTATRFDHAGMITHVTYKGQDYGRYWSASALKARRSNTCCLEDHAH